MLMLIGENWLDLTQQRQDSKNQTIIELQILQLLAITVLYRVENVEVQEEKGYLQDVRQRRQI